MGDTHTIISGTGSFIPERVIRNDHFLQRTFYTSDKKPNKEPTSMVIEKFAEISGIQERRYVREGQTLIDLAHLAAKDAIESSGIDAESLDGLIVAHDAGGFVPSVASNVRNRLGIKNPYMEVYDLTAGCPGWVKGVVLADRQLKTGAKRVMVIGAELISESVDPYDRDCMLFGDGAGAVILESVKSDDPVGVISYASRADKLDAFLMDNSYNPDYMPGTLFIKMNGHAVYKYVVRYVPGVVMESIEKAGLKLIDISKVFVHQANGKMNEDMLQRLFNHYTGKAAPPGVMPMTVSWLGNSSVATVPTLLDLVIKGKLDEHRLHKGNYIVIASVGAGMNIDSIVYRVH